MCHRLQAWFNVGNLERKNGNLQAALEAYRNVLNLKPQHWKALLHMAVTLIGLKRPQEAQSILKDALQLSGKLLKFAHYADDGMCLRA